jgi:hypothetical protein
MTTILICHNVYLYDIFNNYMGLDVWQMVYYTFFTEKWDSYLTIFIYKIICLYE